MALTASHLLTWLLGVTISVPTVNLQFLPIWPPYPYIPPPSIPVSPGLAVPIEVPMPVQVAIPAYAPPLFCKARPRPYNCPVCPPCLCSPCTPSFFSYCSPCHQKCRCRNKNDVPVPMPLNPPVPIPGPAFAMPVLPDPYGIIVPVHKQPKVWDDEDFEG